MSRPIKPDLQTAIRHALAGSSIQQQVDTATLYSHGTRKQVQAALMELYQAREVCCCKIIDIGGENIVWWLSGGVGAPHSYGRLCQPKIAVGRAT